MFSCEVSVIPPLRYWEKVSSKLNMVCGVKEANQSSDTAICSLSCMTPNQDSFALYSHNLSPTQLEAKTSTGKKKILSDEDIADELKKLVTYGSTESNSEF